MRKEKKTGQIQKKAGKRNRTFMVEGLVVAFLLILDIVLLISNSTLFLDGGLLGFANESSFTLTGKAGLYLLLFLVLVMAGFYAALTLKDVFPTNCPVALYPIFLFLGALWNYVMVEVLYNSSLSNVTTRSFCLNLLLHFLILLLLACLLDSVKRALLGGFVFWLFVGVANCFVCRFRVFPIQPQDLFSLGTAMEVSGMYSFSLTLQMVSVIVLCTVFFIIVSVQNRMVLTGGKSLAKKEAESKKQATKNKKPGCQRFRRFCLRAGSVVFAGIFFCLLYNTPFGDVFLPEVYQWSSEQTYQENGFFLSFLSYGTFLSVRAPEDYDAETLSEALADYTDESSAEGEVSSDASTTPNIIVIMVEAMEDLETFRDLELSEDVFENWNALSENAIKGQMLVSTLGGGTANSEYEFLTGNSIAFHGSGSVPYVVNRDKLNFSLAWELKAQGYETIAMHPGAAVSWCRDVVYAQMGFDTFYSYESFDDWSEKKRSLVSDYADYEKMLELIRSRDSDSPYFFFNVTIQNHSDYTTKTVPVSVYSEKAEENLELNEYLTLLKSTDEALGYLVSELEKEEEDTVLVVFGDHFPGVSSDTTYWLLNDTPTGLLGLDETQNLYTVPYLIWANYDIDEGDGEGDFLSANYLAAYMMELLGMELPPWREFLLDLKEEIPAFNALGYSLDGITYLEYGDVSEQPSILQQYWNLMYNQLYDTDHWLSAFWRPDVN